MRAQTVAPHLVALLALTVAVAVMAAPRGGERRHHGEDGNSLDRAADVEELLDVAGERMPKYTPAKPLAQLKVVAKGLKKANGYGAVAKKALKTPVVSSGDSANSKADKLKVLIEMSKEMTEKNKHIRKVLKSKRPDLPELQAKVKAKDERIQQLEEQVDRQRVTISEQNALSSPMGRAARDAAKEAGASSTKAVSLAAAVVGALKSQGAAKQEAAMTAGLVAAASALQSGADMHKATEVAKRETVRNGGNEESATIAAGVVVGDITYEKKPNAETAAFAAAKATQVQGGSAKEQAKAAGATVQRAAGTPAKAGAIAAKVASKAHASSATVQQVAAWVAGLTQMKHRATSAPTRRRTPAPTAPKKVKPGNQTNVPTPAPSPAPSVPPTPAPTPDGLLKYAQEELMKQREHISKTINQIRSELGITKVKVGGESA